MNFSLPPLHPQVPALLDHLGLRVVDVVKWYLLLCVTKDNSESTPTHVVKIGINQKGSKDIAYEARIMKEILSELDQKLFKRLVFPKFLISGENEGLHWLEMGFLKGQPLIYEWSNLDFKPDTLGGRGISKKVAAMSVDVLCDLRLINVKTLPSFVRYYDLQEWINNFDHRSSNLVQLSLLTEEDVVLAKTMFEQFDKSSHNLDLMFVNGDFCARSFVLLSKGKVGVTDWNGSLHPWEFVAMHAWLLMWGNPDWQNEYLQAMKSRLAVDIETFQLGLVIEAFDLIWRWKMELTSECGQARDQMVKYFRNGLNIEFVKNLFV